MVTNRLIVTDSFHKKGEDELQIVLSDVKKGAWTSSIFHTDDEVVKSFFVYNGEKPLSGKWHKHKRMIAVDSHRRGFLNLNPTVRMK